MTEDLGRVCDCNACDTHITQPATGHADGAYCSDMCARHAGGELEQARQEHRACQR